MHDVDRSDRWSAAPSHGVDRRGSPEEVGDRMKDALDATEMKVKHVLDHVAASMKDGVDRLLESLSNDE